MEKYIKTILGIIICGIVILLVTKYELILNKIMINADVNTIRLEIVTWCQQNPNISLRGLETNSFVFKFEKRDNGSYIYKNTNGTYTLQPLDFKCISIIADGNKGACIKIVINREGEIITSKK